MTQPQAPAHTTPMMIQIQFKLLWTREPNLLIYSIQRYIVFDTSSIYLFFIYVFHVFFKKREFVLPRNIKERICPASSGVCSEICILQYRICTLSLCLFFPTVIHKYMQLSLCVALVKRTLLWVTEPIPGIYWIWLLLSSSRSSRNYSINIEE
jgi:hypothetical protein